MCQDDTAGVLAASGEADEADVKRAIAEAKKYEAATAAAATAGGGEGAMEVAAQPTAAAQADGEAMGGGVEEQTEDETASAMDEDPPPAPPAAAASAEPGAAAAAAAAEPTPGADMVDMCRDCPALSRNRHPETNEVWVPYNQDRCLLRVCDKIFECGDDCPYGRSCMLKLVQHGLPRDLEVFNTRNKGWGVRCWHKIYGGDFIAEYVGEILTPEDADRRANDEYFFDTKVVPVDARKDGLHTVSRPCLRLIFAFGSDACATRGAEALTSKSSA